MTKKKLVISAVVVGFCLFNDNKPCADSRFFPWYQKPSGRTIEKRSFFQTDLFFITAGSAYGVSGREKKSIAELQGIYDLKKLSDAVIALGLTSPLLAQWQMSQANIEWNSRQKVEGQGIRIQSDVRFLRGLSFGFSTGIMALNSDISFSLTRAKKNDMGLTTAQEEELDRERRAMHDLLGLSDTHWSQTFFTDTRLQARLGGVWDYRLKSRQVDAAIFSGLFIPSGAKRYKNNPASLPFGGNGLTGFFVGTELNLELREDMFLGLFIELSKRFAKQQDVRIPMKKEPLYFGATSGNIEIDPGVTVHFNPSLTFGDVQGPFGVGLSYHLTHHAQDVWTDMRADKTILVDWGNMKTVSMWNSEYISLTVFYDSGRVIRRESWQPIITFGWDIPVKFIAAEDVSKTHNISFGIDIRF